MKKHLKLMAVLSAAGVLTVAAPELGLISTAATAYAKVVGWVEENGSWKFYDDNDSYVTDAWKKRGEDWYYLNEDGEVATNAQIDEYYVDESGKRVSDKWISMANEEFWDSADAPETLWHYYGKNGKEVISKWQKINDNLYYFNDQGEMMTGKVEIEGSTYYLGEVNDGVMKTGWIKLENDSEDLDETHSWYYFDKSGHMVNNQVDKKIDGNYYTFVNGIMQTGTSFLKPPLLPKQLLILRPQPDTSIMIWKAVHGLRVGRKSKVLPDSARKARSIPSISRTALLTPQQRVLNYLPLILKNMHSILREKCRPDWKSLIWKAAELPTSTSEQTALWLPESRQFTMKILVRTRYGSSRQKVQTKARVFTVCVTTSCTNMA